jgi:ribosomal-protein-alanine N-acetyltransferase
MFWSELAEAATRCYLVAEQYGPPDEEPRLIGYAGLLAGAGEAEVLTIAVAPVHEGRGLGTVLLTELMREAARRDCDDVVLEVRVDNDRAQQLYRRFGFEGVGIRKGYYQPMNIDALVMRSSAVIARFGGESAGGRADDGHGDGLGDGLGGARDAGVDSVDSIKSVDWVRE